MNAQTITFNHDPELSTSEVDRVHPREGYGDNNRCCCPCKFMYWYIAPLTVELCHSLKCIVFHPINFAFCIFLFTFDVTMIAVGIGLIPLCCMGLPLLWISTEFIIAFSRIDLGFHYHFVETSAHLNPFKAHLIQLSLYLTNVPLCCCYNPYRENCVDLMVQRIKYLFTTIEIYKYILYQIVVRPVICGATWWIMIVAVCNIGLLGFPLWFMANDRQFVENRVVVGWAEGCKQMKDGGFVCPHDYVFIINTFSRALFAGTVGLLVLPFTLRINNYFAYLNKVVAYRFYTFYYSKDMEAIESSSPMMTTRPKINSV